MQCRSCMDIGSNNLINMLTTWNGTSFFECFNDCTRLGATLDDELPKMLCFNCINNMRIAFDFLEQARKSDATFRCIALSQKQDGDEAYGFTGFTQSEAQEIGGIYSNENFDNHFDNVEEADVKPNLDEILDIESTPVDIKKEPSENGNESHDESLLHTVNVPEREYEPTKRIKLTDTEAVERKKYKVYSDQDRSKIVEAAHRGEDWVGLAATLGVKYKTAYTWVTSGRRNMLRRGGFKTKSLKEEEVECLLKWIEEDCTISLKQLASMVHNFFKKELSISTIGNYLQGRLFFTKNDHHQRLNMNSLENKAKRSIYVSTLNLLVQAGKKVIYFGETSFNLFCRRSRGAVRSSRTAFRGSPAARGPSIHLIGAITDSGIVMERHRGRFSTVHASQWMQDVLHMWVEMGNNVADLVVVCDNAACQSLLEDVIHNFNSTENARLLRIVPYSPMLNPIELIWPKIQTYVKTNIGIPATFDPGAINNRLSYLEELIDEAKATVSSNDCQRAIQHTATFYSDALSMLDMPNGT